MSRNSGNTLECAEKVPEAETRIAGHAFSVTFGAWAFVGYRDRAFVFEGEGWFPVELPWSKF